MNHVLFICAACLAASLLPASEDTRPPVSRWKLDGNPLNAVAGAPNGETVRPELLSPGSGRENRGTSFSFRDKLSGCIVVKNHRIDFSRPFTIILSIKFHPAAQYNKFKEIISSSHTEFGPGIRLFSFYGKLILRSGDGKNISAIESKATKHKMPLENWARLAVAYNGTSAVIYLNGEEIASGSMKITPYRGALYFGAYNGRHYPLQGELADISIYDFAKSREMLQLDYAESLQ